MYSHDRISNRLFHWHINRNNNRDDSRNTCQYCRSNTFCILHLPVIIPFTGIPLCIDGCNVNSPCINRICSFHAAWGPAGRNRHIHSSRTQNGFAGQIQRSDTCGFSRRVWSDTCNNRNASDFCNCTADTA